MKIAIMQPYIFPYIGYFQLISAVDKFIIYDDVAFIKQGWINRNNILLDQKKYLFVVPVSGISSFKKIRDTKVDYRINWTKKILLTINQTYKRAPNFLSVFPLIETVFLSKNISVSEIAVNSLIAANNYIGLKTEFERTSVIYNNNNLNGMERLIDICRKENATYYFNSIGGQEMYSKEDFLKYNIELCFLKPFPIEYKQFNNSFVPGLSIIDVMMFNSPDEIKEMLTQFELV